MKILVSGGGIAGPCLAYWLAHYGLYPTIVEKAPHLRTGGYVVDFWGLGYDIAERMGLMPEIKRKGYEVEEVRVVSDSGRRVAGFPVSAFIKVTKGRYVSIARSALSRAIYGALPVGVESIFGDSIESVEQRGAGVRVRFQNAAARDYDLVVGADGLHSRVRELVFGPESEFESYLGYKAAAFQVDGYQPRDELTYVMYPQVGQQVARFSMRDDRTMFLFTFADADPGDPAAQNLDGQKGILRQRFGKSGWECRRILDALDAAEDLYFDRVSQIRMDPRPGWWSKGRITLAGDAASCISLLGGEGSGLAMLAAYILAGELHQSGGDYAKAFARYQQQFGPLVLQKQKAARRFAGVFAPKSRLSLFLHNQIMNLLTVDWIARLTARRTFVDNFRIPEYQ